MLNYVDILYTVDYIRFVPFCFNHRFFRQSRAVVSIRIKRWNCHQRGPVSTINPMVTDFDSNENIFVNFVEIDYSEQNHDNRDFTTHK